MHLYRSTISTGDLLHDLSRLPLHVTRTIRPPRFNDGLRFDMPFLVNPKHEHFAQLVANGVTATEAAKIVGYSEKRAAVTGSELVKNRNVCARITEFATAIMERAVEKLGIDKAWVIAELVDNVKTAKQAVPVLDNAGKPTAEYRQQLNAANRALELIGKELGMFVDRKEIRSGPLSNLTDEQLEQLIAALDSGVPAAALDVFGKAGAREAD